jgi:CBS domain-containing protein
MPVFIDWLGRQAVTVADLIGVRREVYAVRDDFSVEEAARYLRDMHVRAVGVLDRHDDLVGVVSQSDISDKVAAENKCPAWMRVADIMTPDVLTVTLEESIDECLRLMDENGVYHLVVIDAGGAFRGMISVADLLRVAVQDQKSRADLLEAFIVERPS